MTKTMAKELPYFRFTAQEWQNGDISLENYALKGLFVDVCAYYWVKNCELTQAMLKKRFRDAKDMIDELINLGIIKHNEKTDFIQIQYLDEQLDILQKKREARQEAGRKGGKQRSSNAKATLKQSSSYKDKDKDKDKDRDIPTLDDFLDYAKSKEPLIVESDVRYKYEAWKENDWKDAKGKPIKNWKTKLMNSMKYFDKHKSIQEGYKQVEIINLDKQQTEDKIKDERENLQFRMAKAINNYSIDFHKANNIPIGDDVTDVKAGEEMEYIAKLLENYEEEFIGKVMTWLWINKENGETFWRKYVINAKKFYEKFEKMKLAMINDKQKEKRL